MVGQSLNGTAVAGNGRNLAEARQTPAPVRQQPSMLESARAGVCDFLSNLIGSRRAEVGHKLYPDLDPITASENLGRNLRGKDGRKVGLHEIDPILDVLGPEAEERWFRFCLLRRGIQPPVEFERPDEIDRLRAEVADLREQLAERDATIRSQAEAFAKGER